VFTTVPTPADPYEPSRSDYITYIVDNMAALEVHQHRPTVDGDGAGTLLLDAGSVGVPVVSREGDTNTGLWFPAADTIAISTGGTERLRISSAGVAATIAAAAATTIPAIIAPAVDVSTDGAASVTTSGTTEIVVITGNGATNPITNPTAAGRIIVWATINLVSPTVANDIFLFRIRFGATSVLAATDIARSTVAFTSTSERKTVTLVGSAAIAASGAQYLGITMVRDTGTGTVTAENGRSQLQWIIIPGAGITA